MRLVWTDQRPKVEVVQTLKARGYEAEPLVSYASATTRITRRFPIFIDRQGRLVSEVFDFLFDVAFVRGSTRSLRTLETYAESLLCWLSFAERTGLRWRKPTVPILATYRDHMLGTVDEGAERRVRPLARSTVNLRLTVAIEFYKHLGSLAHATLDATGASVIRRSGIVVGSDLTARISEFQRLRVRAYRRRPKALAAQHCRALCDELPNPYRLVWQWQLCTGLRVGSVVRLKLSTIKRKKGMFAPQLSVPAKGGKVATVHVPAALWDATARYIDVDRELALSWRADVHDDALFLTRRGRPVSAKGFYRSLRRAAARLGIRTHPHQARTTFATYVRDKLEQRAQERRSPLDAVKVVQALLDHASAETTEVYLESIDVPSIDVLEILDQLADSALRVEG